jgi:propanol-preferring alcohol dehydrogenase
LAREVGAHDTVRSNADAIGGVRALVGRGPGGADVVLDFVGSQDTLDLARATVSTGGDIVIVGLAGGRLPAGFGTLPFETRVTMTFWGTKAELAEVIALARAGRVAVHVEQFALADAQTAYDRLKAGSLRGRAVVIPG